MSQEYIDKPGIRTVRSSGKLSGMEESTPAAIDTTHPFDNPDFLAFLEREFPHSLEAVRLANRPIISDNPDELEAWEADQILRRKIRFSFEEDNQYLSRLIYEESYAVNQHPGMDNPPMFRGVPGLTPGGLVSHFYMGDEGTINRSTIKDALTFNLQDTLGETLAGIDDHKTRLMLADIVVYNAYPIGRGDVGYDNTFFLIDKPLETPYPPHLDSVGLRLLKMLQATPEMLKVIEDEQLRIAADVQNRGEISVSELLVRSWGKFSRILYEEPGSYEDPEIRKALSELLFLRTHPQLQIFYRYLSPSGYINNISSVWKLQM